MRGAIIATDGYVDIDDVSSDESGPLLCHTRAIGCCSLSDGQQAGDWFLPNGSRMNNSARMGGYRRNRGTGVVRLYRDSRTSSASALRGRFRCEIPDANNISQALYINICK